MHAITFDLLYNRSGDTMKFLGEELKYQREKRNLSQEALANATGLKQQMISWWEADKGLPNIEFCVRLADYYGITLDELIGRKL